MKKAVLLFVAVGFSISVLAEFRIWTDQNGNQMEAEFIRVSGKNIVLKRKDGKQRTVSPMMLSVDDQEYLWSKIPADLLNPSKSSMDREKPPRLDVKVAKKTDTKKEWDKVDRDISCIIKIRRLSSPGYTRKLKAVLFVLGISKEHDYYVMIDKKDFEFDFNNSPNIELSGNSARITYLQSSNYGIEYKGYVLVITDDEGNELQVLGSSHRLEEGYDKLSKFSRNDVFSQSFEKKGTRSSMGSAYYE